jgi:FMN phosphatase YigB (HAD superfamily)
MASVDAIFFDLDETLLDDNTSYELAISRVAAEMASAYPRFGFKTFSPSTRGLRTSTGWMWPRRLSEGGLRETTCASKPGGVH